MPDAAYDKPGTVYRPFFDAIPGQTATVGQATSLVVTARSILEGATLVHSSTGLPAGATFDPAARRLSWTPTPGQVGAHTIGFIVHDGVLPVRRDVSFVVVAGKDQ